MSKKVWKALAVWALCMALAIFGWISMRNAESYGGTPWPFRKVFDFNHKFFNFFNRGQHAPLFNSKLAGEPRVNGNVGMESDIDIQNWKMNITFSNNVFEVDMVEISKLPHVEMTTELKCIEGWSQIVKWGGVRLGDFLEARGLEIQDGESLEIATPDGEYFVGIDKATALHGQTLLAYEMNDEPLTTQHGAPLRLVTPLKYGIKNIKRIGSIKLVSGQARDYWAEAGYDWHSSH